jgi:hypothetical protein
MSLRGDAVFGFGGRDPAVAVVAVSVADVAGERVSEAVPVEVVGVRDDEFAECGEVALDRVEVAGVGWSRDELDLLAAAKTRIGGTQLAERLSWIQ